MRRFVNDLVVEREVKLDDFEGPQFAFIMTIFQECRWPTLFEPTLVYIMLVHDFYANVNSMSFNYPSSFKAKL